MLNEESCQLLLEKCLKVLKKSSAEVVMEAKMIEWKCAIASYIKSKRSVKNQFFSEHLNMGSIYTVSRSVSEYNKDKKEKCNYRKQLIAKVKA